MAGQRINVLFDRTRDPQINLEREERLFQLMETRKRPDTFRFWINSECLVKGPARSPKYGWYHQRLAEEMGIKVIQRSTGGGVVYHDLGNLNWSFCFVNSGRLLSPTKLFERASWFVIRTLERLGVNGHFASPNRIDVLGRKVSGMAARSTPRTSLVHGTLLLNSDLEKLNKLCIPPEGCPPVANLSEWVDKIDASKVVSTLAGILRESGLTVTMRNPG